MTQTIKPEESWRELVAALEEKWLNIMGKKVITNEKEKGINRNGLCTKAKQNS